MGFLLEVGISPHLPCSLRTLVTWVTLCLGGVPGLVGPGAAATMAGEAVSFPGPLLQPTRDLGTLRGGAGVPTVHRSFWQDLSQVRGDGGGFGGASVLRSECSCFDSLVSQLFTQQVQTHHSRPLLQPTQAYSHL